MANTFGIILIVALWEEARPLIESLGLVKRPNTRLDTYENSTTILVICGLGFTSTCTAVGYAANLLSDRNPLFWLNIGTAGHKFLSIGTVVIPAKIEGLAHLPPFYPTSVFHGDHETTELVTVTKANNTYPERFCVDMEAIGFCLSSSRFSLKDYIQVVKVISDNQDNPASALKKGRLGHVIDLKLETLTNIINQFTDFAKQESEHEVKLSLPNDLRNIHFTETQKINLHRLLSQLFILAPNVNLEDLNIDKKNSSSVLKSITSLIETNLPKVDDD